MLKNDNINIFINRVKKYNPNGRNETQEQAKELDALFKSYLDVNEIDYICVDGNEKGLDDAFNYIMNIINKQKALESLDLINFKKIIKEYDENIYNKIIANNNFDKLYNDFCVRFKETEMDMDYDSMNFFFNHIYRLDESDYLLILSKNNKEILNKDKILSSDRIKNKYNRSSFR